MVTRLILYITNWRLWHWFAKYIVIAPAWVWLCIKARSFWFFTPSNPTITFGGFLGESKTEIYKQLPLGTYPSTTLVNPDRPVEGMESLVSAQGLTFPVVAKPDVGQMGLMFRKIDNIEQLQQYHRFMPVPYVLQEYVDYPVEVSVFYYRRPGEAKGHISGFVRKECMQVVGDGVSTLKRLINEHPQARFRRKELYGKHESKLNGVIPEGQVYILCHALNLSRGGRLVNLEHEIDEQLLNVFDNIGRHASGFFYGRYDIKCQSIADLKAGRNFSILEYNGAGAEPHHVYGGGFTFFGACAVLIRHWRLLYEISLENKKRGVPFWHHEAGRDFLSHARRHLSRLKRLDQEFEFTDSVETIMIPADLVRFAREYVQSLSSKTDLI